WERQVANVETTLDEWQWVQEPTTEGYFYNAVTGEARWDEPTAFQEDSSQALVERGYMNSLAGAGVVNEAPELAGGELTLTQFYGGHSNEFTAEDGTAWKYDEALGDYVQRYIDEPMENAKGGLFRLNTVVGSPWQRVESEHGVYYYNLHTEESSWEPPPEWQDNLATDWADHSMDRQGRSVDSVADTALQQLGGSATPDAEWGGDGEISFDEPPQNSAFSSVTSGTSYDASAVGNLGVEEREKGRNNAFDGAAASEDPPPHAESNAEGDSVNRDGGGGSGSSSLDRTSADEFSQWSLEKLRESLPGKWLVSDSLMKRAVEDYDTMLAMSASEIEAIKNKGTSRVIRSLVGPEDGEDDFDEDSSLCPDSDAEAAGSDEYPNTRDTLGKPDGRAAATEEIATLQASQEIDLRLRGGGKGATETGGRPYNAVGEPAGGGSSYSKSGGLSLSRRPGQEDGDGTGRRRSLLGLEEALSVDANREGLGGWQ
ncbi:unnamed protein product, partial [Hapterophycus canaliculatus]